MDKSIKMIDIGINLMSKQFNNDREQIVERALENGIGLIITGTDLKSSEQAINFIRKHTYQNIWCTVGCHPHNAKEMDLNYYKELNSLIENNKDIVVAVGETGLDYDRMFSPLEQQKKALSQMQYMAISSDLPMFLHERKAENDFVKIMKTQRTLCRKSIVHCFTGSKETVYRYLQMGFYIGITGWVCDNRRNKELLEAIKIIPIERILIETDATYLTPQGLNLDRRNTPDNLHYVLEKIAEIKKVDKNLLEESTLSNSRNLFNL